MANTYSQVYLQFVFAVKGRQSLINPMHNDELQKYITGFDVEYDDRYLFDWFDDE